MAGRIVEIKGKNFEVVRKIRGGGISVKWPSGDVLQGHHNRNDRPAEVALRQDENGRYDISSLYCPTHQRQLVSTTRQDGMDWVHFLTCPQTRCNLAIRTGT